MKTETNEILEEVYRIRREIFDECGGTLHGLFQQFSADGRGKTAPRKRLPAWRKTGARNRKNKEVTP